jgi:hypothetical protein
MVIKEPATLVSSGWEEAQENGLVGKTTSQACISHLNFVADRLTPCTYLPWHRLISAGQFLTCVYAHFRLLVLLSSFLLGFLTGVDST